MKIDFDPVLHEYKIDGRPAPAVSDVLHSVGLVDYRWYTELGRWRGSALHQALLYIDEGTVDPESLDDMIIGYIRAYEAFKRDYDMEILEMETPTASTTYWYAGTPDRRVKLYEKIPHDAKRKINGRLTIIDFKTGEPEPWHPFQLGGYRGFFAEPHDGLDIYLGADGKYRPRWHNEPRWINLFRGAAAIHNFKLNAGIKFSA